MARRVNFVFVRHGHGCHNAANAMRGAQRNAIVVKPDPVLTLVGIGATKHNGAILRDVLRQHGINDIHMVGSSPLLRCMETSILLSSVFWGQDKGSVFVFPHLREIDERSSDKFSRESRMVIDSKESYAMLPVVKQKRYLCQQGVRDRVDFSFVEHPDSPRSEPGDIPRFIQWFYKHVLPVLDFRKPTLNVVVTTHAGVLRDFRGEAFPNNAGILVETNVSKHGDNERLVRVVNLNDQLMSPASNFYHDYSNAPTHGICPLSRCGYHCPS